MNEEEPAVKSADDVKVRSNALSHGLLRIVDLRGDLRPPGNAVGLCGDRDADEFYRINNFWSLAGPSATELHSAMDRLVAEMPKHGWEIAEHGREETEARDRYLKGNNKLDKFSVYVALLEPAPNSQLERPLLSVSLTSACYQVPDGEKTGY
ncbi:hypothetical protein [Streptomyces youssoufiensis]